MLALLAKEPFSYVIAREKGSHKQLRSPNGYPPLTFSFGDNEMLGPTMVRKILTEGIRLSDADAMEVLS